MTATSKSTNGERIAGTNCRLSQADVVRLQSGQHHRLYECLGAHPTHHEGIAGTYFAVWAPNASRVWVVGDFNDWSTDPDVLQVEPRCGVWSGFIPGCHAGATYKFRIVAGGTVFEKSDPLAFLTEVPPRTASIVADLDKYQWCDQAWMHERPTRDPLKQPLSIYEVHLGSWRRGGDGPNGWCSYRDLAHKLVDYCRHMGYSHLELMPVHEHPLTTSWGYQATGFYSVTSRHGKPEDFMYFVDHCHQNGIGVIIDWVPAHFCKDGQGLRLFDGTALYEHKDPRRGEHPDWGTMIFNYGRHEVRNFLVANALFWLDKYHVDGLRVDAVASMLYLDYSRKAGQWIPNEHGGRENLDAIGFLKEFNEVVRREFPGTLTIAEESTAWEGVSRPSYVGGLGFSLTWNMGWMHDSLRYLSRDPIYRKYHHNELTFSLIYAFQENFVLALSHDEVVHGKSSLLAKMPGDDWQKFANLRLLYSYMWCHPGKKLLFMGGDFGQWQEWNCEAEPEWGLLAWERHRGMHRLVADLNRIYQSEAALFELDFSANGFEWIDCHNYEASTLCFLRKSSKPEGWLIVCCNFTPVARNDYRVGVPRGGDYRVVFNSDSQHYGGSNAGDCYAVSQPIASHGREHSVALQLPPLAVLVLKPVTAS